MVDHNSDEGSSGSEAASLQSSHSSASSYSRQSSRSADSSRGGGSADSASVASSRSVSSRSAASSRSSRSRSSSRSNRSSNRSSRQSSVASRSETSSFDIDDATGGMARIALEGNNDQENNADHSDDDSGVSSGPPTSASDSREGSRSPFTEAESHQSRSVVSNNMGGEEFLNKANDQVSPQSSSDHYDHQYLNGRRTVLTQSMVVGAAENLSPSMNQGGKRVHGGPLTASMIAAVAAETSPAKNEGKRKNVPPILTQSMVETAAEGLVITPTEGNRVMTRDEVIGSTIEMPTPPLDTKYIKIKLMDPSKNTDDKATEEPIFMTLKIEIPTSQEPSWSNIDTSVGMGQSVQMSFPENGGKGRPINIQGKRVEIRHDKSDKERINTEMDKILGEVTEELSPEDVIIRKHDETEKVQLKKQNHFSQQHQSNGPPLRRRRSSDEVKSRRKASVEHVSEENKNNRPPLTRRRSSVELQPRRRRSDEDVPDEHQDNRPTLVRRKSSDELQPRRSSEAHSVESLPTPEKGLQPFTIPSLITSTVTKSDPNQKVGLAFRKSGGANTVIIDKIAPVSPFQGSALRSGHEILCINGQRVHTARRAAEVVRESRDSLTLVVSNAIRPPGTMYTMVSLAGHRDVSSSGKKNNYVAGLYFKMKNGLVQLMKTDEESPVAKSSMKVGDFILAVNGKVTGSISKVVDEFVNCAREESIPVLYFNMCNLRVTLVDTNIDDRWEKEWSDYFDECKILLPESPGSLTLRFKEDGRCELVDPSQKTNGKAMVSVDHRLQSAVEAINYGIICLLSAIREGVQIASNGRNAGRSPTRIQEVKQRGHDKLAEILNSGLLNEDEYRAIKSKLAASNLVE